MIRMILAAGAATLALAAPAYAGPGGHGEGRGGGGENGGGMVMRGGGGEGHGGGRAFAIGGFQERDHGRAQMPDRPERDDGERRAVREFQAQHGREVRVERDEHFNRPERVVETVRHIEGERREWTSPWRGEGLANGFVNGCPPGLAAKNNGCLPPGQAKKIVGAALPSAYAAAALEGPWRNWYRDDDRYTYRMGDGYIYRVSRADNLVNALIPYGIQDYGYYPVGQMYPAEYNYYNVPYPYQSYYPDGGNLQYRYGNGAIYGVDPRTSMIQSIVALLAGDLSVGQRLPTNYSVYNVPLAYRSQYYDTPTDWYRYNDGYIYRVDPTTQLITAIAKALV